jgi:hypothetical protein
MQQLNNIIIVENFQSITLKQTSHQHDTKSQNSGIREGLWRPLCLGNS